MTKVSVIIPVYNVEKYLRKCLDSVCNQTLKDIEIICVNDCSPDNSLEIIKEYATKDNRIKIIDFKENKGVAIARNTAMTQAKGEYIGFVDPDDWIDLNFYEKLYNKAKKIKCELVIANVQIETLKSSKQNDHIMSDILNKIKNNCLYFNQLFWLGLYKTNLLRRHNIKFIEHCIYGEERLLPLMASFYSNGIGIVDSTFYHYTRYDSSITKKEKDENVLNSFVLSVKKIYEFINKVNLPPQDYNCVCDVFLENCLSFSLELKEDLKDKFYDKFKNEIIVLLDDKKLNKLYKEIMQNIDLHDLESFENFAKKYMNQMIFNLIRKNINKNRGTNV